MAKETSGLLMNVIGTLSSLQSNEQRDREKAKLEREFKLSDQRLEKLVSTHHKDLATIMQIYGKASARISDTRSRIAVVKGQLAACRVLLHCKRDELKKLWLEGVEHKEVLLMLNQIENLKNMPDQISEHVGRKDYKAAAQLVVQAQENLQGPLLNIEGLKEVRNDLAAKQEHFYNMLVEDLSHFIYVKSSNDVLQWRRAASAQTPFQRASSGRNSSGRASGNLKSEAPKVKSLTLEIVGNQQMTLDENSKQAIANIIECLSLLNKLPETLESLKSSMGKEMTSVTNRTAQQVSEMYPVIGNKNVLKELFEAVMEQMRRIVAAHVVILDNVKGLLAKEQMNNADIALYTKEDVWSQVQTVMQVLLSQYWNINQSSSNKNNSTGSFSSNSQMAATDLNAYFSKRKPTKGPKASLFRFEGSLHSMSLSDSTGGKSDENGLDGGDRVLIVEPNARLVIEIYQPLMAFVDEIEKALGLTQGSHCALHVFITVFTRDVFISQIHFEMGKAMDEATRKVDMWKSVNPTESMQHLKATRPLLQSAVQVHRCLTELRQLMEALPQFSQHFLGEACNMLVQYIETCQAAYRGVVQPESEDKRVISATWAKDEDINRFLRSLPSWTALQTVRARRNATGNTDGETYEDSPEEIKQRSAKETEILTGNLGDTFIPPQEILADPAQLRILALLQESLEWLAGHIKEFASAVKRSNAAEASVPLPETNSQPLTELAKDFEALADTCLLVLHLEVRVHCFYHLVPLGRQAQFWLTEDDQESDFEIGRLSRDLTSIDESLNAFLQPRKHRYIFEGVSHLVASILMSSVQHIRRMNENGVKKMCRNIFALQQTLTSITLAREPALDYARQYFELLCLTPEKILNGILERGPQYTELEYIQILQLLNRSRPGTGSNEITRHLERLSEILGDLGVTV